MSMYAGKYGVAESTLIITEDHVPARCAGVGFSLTQAPDEMQQALQVEVGALADQLQLEAIRLTDRVVLSVR